jgi:hypothetical protein
VYISQRSGVDIKVDHVQNVYDDANGEEGAADEMGQIKAGEGPGGDPLDMVESIDKVVEEETGPVTASPERRWDGGKSREYQEDNPWA